MRKFTLFLLLATSAVPAMAAPEEEGARQSPQSEQSDSRPQRAERAERKNGGDRPQRQMQVERQRSQPDNAGLAAMRERIQQQQIQQQQAQQLQIQQQQVTSERGERRQRYLQRRNEALRVDQQAQGSELLPRQGRYRSVPDTRPEVLQQPPTTRDGRIGTRHYRGDGIRWSNHWRNDRRYDWRRHRDRNRSIFRIGFYFDPFGYGYRRYSLGSYLYPSYYQSSFWINDPWQYRLPPAYGPYRWVRYHNDALLVDTWTGEVVDVIYGFFW